MQQIANPVLVSLTTENTNKIVHWLKSYWVSFLTITANRIDVLDFVRLCLYFWFVN